MCIFDVIKISNVKLFVDFIFIRRGIMRNIRKFAPIKNFPLYGMLAPVYTTHADPVPNPLLWIFACVNVLVTTPILCLFSKCSKRLFVVSRQHETSSSGAYAWSLLRNQAQTAKEASREKISGV